MDMLLQNQKGEKRGINKVFLVAALIAIVLLAGVAWLFTLQPTAEEQKQQAMTGSHFEGSPEFEAYTNNIIINTDMNRTMESPTGLGTIAMSIHADVRNRGNKTINGLELRVGMVDRFNKVLKERKVMVIPNQAEKLNPQETIHVSVPMDGFKKDDDRANVRWKVTAIRFD
jgi:hypothetical protein